MLTSHRYSVTNEHTAQNVGSGGLEVLSTPSLIAFIENAAYLYCQEQLATDSKTTVGTEISIRHLAPSAVGETITVVLETYHQNRSKHTFELNVYNENHTLIATGTHTRASVNQEQFMQALHSSH